ncbi:MAG: hypothetical protein AB1410_02740 [Acidobacteriota bacterium]
MKDTSSGMEKKFNSMLMQRSGEDRVKMGFSMNDSARRLVIASILNKNPNASPLEIRRELFLRFYGIDFDKKNKEKILKFLEGYKSNKD